MIEEILELINQFEKFDFVHVKRKLNQFAHERPLG